MQISDQRAIRWEPANDLPETPCYDVSVDSPASGRLRLILQYHLISGNADRDLALDFSDVIAFRMFWDGDGPRLRDECDVPFCENPQMPYVWPLIEVVNSRWLASENLSVSRELGKAHRKGPLRHFNITSLERKVDVIARGQVEAGWLARNF